MGLHELAAILDTAAIGILFTRERRIQRCNLRAAQLLGYAHPEDLLGQPALIAYPDADSYERLGRAASPLLAAGQAFHCEWLLRKRVGSDIWCSIHARAVDPEHTEHGTVWIFDDVSESKRTQQALAQSVREMEAIMRNAPVGIVFTRDRRLVRYNRRFGEMFGFEGEAGVGQPARLLYRTQAEYDELGRSAAPRLSNGEPFQTELFMRRQDGADLWVNLIAYVQNRAQPSEGTIWITEDRSSFKQAEDELRRAHAELVKAKQRAEDANRAKSVFLANMSHELRTPLNAVLGYAQLLKLTPEISERHAAWLDVIHQGGQHLLALIDDVLDLARVEAGRLELHPGTVNLFESLRIAADVMRLKAEQKHGWFEFDVPQSLQRPVAVDERRLRQILLNLLGNAVKFTDSGTIRLAVQIVDEDTQRLRLRFAVSDTGMGIEHTEQARLFQPFEQVGEAGRRAGGTGLGLAISRQLVQAMGGDLQVDSEPGRGTRFTFELDIDLADQAAAPTAPARRIRGYRGRRRQVLVVDDIAENRTLIVEYLRALDFRLAEAGNGLDALAQAEATRPDLIVMDNMMPTMSGLEATRRLRLNQQFDTTPIITVSASGSRADRDASLAAGVNAFLPKPLDMQRLLDEMAVLMHIEWVYEGDAGAS